MVRVAPYSNILPRVAVKAAIRRPQVPVTVSLRMDPREDGALRLPRKGVTLSAYGRLVTRTKGIKLFDEVTATSISLSHFFERLV